MGCIKMENIAVVCDFDGTLTQKDVGEVVLDKFGNPSWKIIDKEWSEGVYGSKIALDKQFSEIRCSKEELFEFLTTIELDPYTKELIEFCKDKEIPFFVVSDGFDLYIEKVFELNNIKAEFFANHAEIQDNLFKIDFPFTKKGCGWCANCKKFHISNIKKTSPKIIYVGDGDSDRHAAKVSDVVFAKDKLEKYCQKKEIDYILYKNLKKVINYLKEVEDK